jgi:hypothetical protein
MNLSLQAKLAESADRYLTSWPLFLGLIGLNNAVQALQFFYSIQEFTWMQVLHPAVKVTVLGAVALLLWRSARFAKYAKACNSRSLFFLEGFLNRINLQALAFSWFFTFFAAQGLGEWTEPEVFLYGAQDLASLQPVRFYFHVLLSCLCVSYALCFFLLSHLQGGEEDA